MHNLKIQLSNLVILIHSTIDFFRIQSYHYGQDHLSKIITDINTLLTTNGDIFPEEYIAGLIEALQNILQAQQNQDLVLLADLLEAYLYPSVNDILQLVLDNIEDDEYYLEQNLSLLEDKELAAFIANHAQNMDSITDYLVEFSNLGVPTLKYNGVHGEFYYHSNNNPVKEGYQLATYYSKPEQLQYTVLGFGFGYHIQGFLAVDKRYKITVIETNPDVLTLAFIYCDLSHILTESRLEIQLCPISKIGDLLSASNVNLIIHHPSLRALEDGASKEALSTYFLNTNSRYANEKQLDYNYYYNMLLQDAPVDSIRHRFEGKSMIYLGGGPSLEHFMDYVRCKQHSDYIITCASTVYKKLLANHIVPDYVFIIDPKDIMRNHTENTPKTEASLIYLSTACYDAVKAFLGTRYIAFQNGSTDAKDYAIAHNLTLFNTRTSVTSLAIDIAIKYKAKKLITIGLDSAYTDNKRHSFDSIALDNTETMLQVPGVSGNMVSTTPVLNKARLWIENRIAGVTGITFINLSKGAYINGMINLDDCEHIPDEE